MMRKAKQISAIARWLVCAGLVLAQVGRADDAGKNFLPVPSEVTTTQPAYSPKPVAPVTPATPVVTTAPVAPVLKTDTAPDLNAQMLEMRKRSATASASAPTGDWAAYNRDRLTNVLLDGKLVDKATLTPLVGFLVKEHATLSDGTKTFTGAALDIAERKAVTNKVATAMELRPQLWRNTNERVFLLNYKSVTLPGALIRVYVQEADPLEGWRTFKAGVEPSFEDWKRLTSR